MNGRIGSLPTFIAFGCAALLIAGGACSSDSNDANSGDGAAGAGNGTGSVTGSGSGTGDGAVLEGVNGIPPAAAVGDGGLLIGGQPVTPVLPGEECAGTAYEGESLPLNMIIMMDRSISMGDSREDFLIPETGGTKWAAAREGLASFFSLPAATGLGVAIDFFGQSSCDIDDYSTPEVEVGTLPDHGDPLLAAYDEWSPDETTPLGPALAGAIEYAKQWKRDNAGQEIIVVQVTDGVPNGCGAEPSPSDVMREGVDDIALVAAAGLSGEPSVRTFVLGIEGLEVSPEDFRYTCTTISQAGGSDPIIVQANDNLAQEFGAALDDIRDQAAPPCSYRVPLPPPDEELDLSRVNVVLEPVSGDPEGIVNVGSASNCEYGGWYYDPPDDPRAIELCPNTCAVVSQQVGAGFTVLFGCGTVSVPEIT